MMRKPLFSLALAACCCLTLSATAEEQPLPGPAAVDEALLTPPSLVDGNPTQDAVPESIPTQTAPSNAADNPMTKSNVATVNILGELEQRAQQGDAKCQFQLGYLYANGKGVRQDDKEAVHWYRLSAKNGDPNGLIAMAEAFDLGRGVAQNAVAAYVLAKAAVAIKPEAAVVANQMKAKLTADAIAKADAMTVQKALKLK